MGADLLCCIIDRDLGQMTDNGENRDMDSIRSEIDDIDRRLIELLRERASLAQAIGKLKGSDGRPFFTPERERQIYERLRAEDVSPLRPDQVVAIFREVISAARAAEKQMSVSYWGPAGTYSHLAAIETFGRSTSFEPADTIEDVFRAVEQNQADYGVVPIENSIFGVVPETLDMFPQTNVRICAETFVPIHHNLASTAASLDDIERIYAGPQPYNQCRHWIKANLAGAEIVNVTPTSRAAQMAAEDPRGAAVANRLCTELYGLTILQEHIEDKAKNTTRFVIVGYNEPAPSGRDKTSIMFSLRNKPGQLYTVLGAFERHGVNLMMIESRPAQRASFEYIFYVDCADHHTDPSLTAAIAEIKEFALETTILGSYPSNDPNLVSI
ncbi:MAG: prephenate dehydratase [Armatimonadetes bacterium]|nr:prephenate dehydratase [Armatimonadota bacterium]